MLRRLSLILRSAIYISGFMLLWLWLMPRWMSLNTSWAFPFAIPARWAGILPLLLGASLAIACFANFIAAGQGTPAPFDAPRRLVISGPYRYVRNPMYLGAGLFLAGCAILFSVLTKILLWYAIGLVAGVNLFILAYEEPTLTRKFNGSYLEYCRNVGRWLPRLRPWSAANGATATHTN